jgi:ribosomal protein S18 acetylase RimI-like enzyme
MGYEIMSTTSMIVVRNMRFEDIPSVYRMGKSDSGFQVAEGEESCFWSLDQLESWVSAGEDVLLVAVDGEKIVGFVLTALHKPTGKVTWENELVLPGYQGRGIGSLLKEEMLRQLKEKGAKYLHFLVKADNPNIAHYEKRFPSGGLFRWFGKFF